ncbi:MAG: LysR family transcriptional regulator [Aliidongia sp.]
MEIDQVRYFLALARLLNFTRAADHCNISQPALTRAIQKLEQEFGGPLIYRERHLTQLTELGKIVLPTFETILSSVDLVHMQAQDYIRRDIAPLNIGLAPSICPTVIMAALSQIADMIPGLQIEMMEEAGERLVDMLLDGTINAALVNTLEEVPERINRWRLFEGRYVVLAAQSHPLAGYAEIPCEALKDSVWLERMGCDLTNRLWQVYFGPGTAPKIGHHGREETHLQYMAVAGLGVMLAPEHAPRLSSLAAIPVEGDLFRHEVDLLVVAGRRYSPALDALVKIARLRSWQGEAGYRAPAR